MRYRCEFTLKIGERDHQYICDPNTPTEEAEYALNHFLKMVDEIKGKSSASQAPLENPQEKTEDLSNEKQTNSE